MDQYHECPRLVVSKRIRNHQKIHWIGFAVLDHDVTISSQDLDCTVLESWIKWLDITGMDQRKEEERMFAAEDELVPSSSWRKGSNRPELVVTSSIEQQLSETRCTFIIDELDRAKVSRLKKHGSGAQLSRHGLLTYLLGEKVETERKHKEDPFNAEVTLRRVFKSIGPSFRSVHSLTASRPFAVEMKCKKAMLGSVLKVRHVQSRSFFAKFSKSNFTFLCVTRFKEISEIFGDSVSIKPQIVYEKLMIDAKVWNFMLKKYLENYRGAPLINHGGKQAAATIFGVKLDRSSTR